MVASVEQYAAAQRKVADQAQHHFNVWLMSVPNPTQDELATVVTDLIRQYGAVAAENAAAWYDDWRETAIGSTVDFPDRPLGYGVDEEYLTKQLRKGEKPSSLISWAVQQQGRNTVKQRCKKDPAGVRWARVPVGKTCAFCLMLASRGAVYLTEGTAGGKDKYHADCNCQPKPVKNGAKLPYNVDALRDMYYQSGGDLKAWRRAYPDLVTDGVLEDRHYIGPRNRSEQAVRRDIKLARKVLDGLGLSDVWLEPKFMSNADATNSGIGGVFHPVKERVEINLRNKRASVTTVHEMVHVRDFYGAFGDERKNILRMLRDTDTYREISSIQPTPENRKTLNYLTENEELLARTYTQWVASLTDNARFKEQWSNYLNEIPSYRQWREDELTEVYRVFARLKGVSK